MAKEIRQEEADDEDFEELAAGEFDDDKEFDEEEELVSLPPLPAKRGAIQVPRPPKQAPQQQQRAVPRVAPPVARPPVEVKKVMKAPVVNPSPQSRKFVAMNQPERTVVAYADTGEIIAEDMPMWAAMMYADLKNDLNELRDAIGKV